MRILFQRLALLCFAVYLAVFPGSTITVALDAVPAWGAWMGAALLLVQGAVAVCWLLGMYGGRGALAGMIAFALGWGVEHLGETTGFPFGRYSYTSELQPQIAGVVPLPIVCAWLMVALGSWQLARLALGAAPGAGRLRPALLLLSATMLLVLDLQIETVATLVNPYWIWVDSGPFYGVPVSNFIAWWVVGLLMAVVLDLALGVERLAPVGGGTPAPEVRSAAKTVGIMTPSCARWLNRLVPMLPSLLYILSSIMFTSVNLARGYLLAGLVGVVFLLVAAAITGQRGLAAVAALAAGQRFDRSHADHV